MFIDGSGSRLKVDSACDACCVQGDESRDQIYNNVPAQQDGNA